MAVFPKASLAVMVRLSATPAVGVVDAAANTRLLAVAELTAMVAEMPALPPRNANVTDDATDSSARC